MRYRGTSSAEWTSGTTLNISNTGVLFEGDLTLSFSAELEMDLILPIEVGSGRVLARGTVARVASPPGQAADDARLWIAATIDEYEFFRDDRAR